VKLNGGSTDHMVGATVVEVDGAIAQDLATREDHIRHPAGALPGLYRSHYGLRRTAEDVRGITAVEQDGAQAVVAGVGDAVIEQRPAGGGFEGRAGDADFARVPHAGARAKDLNATVQTAGPEVEVVDVVGADVAGNAVEHEVVAANFFGDDAGIFVVHA